MQSDRLTVRFARLGRSRQLLLAEALAMIFLAAIAIRLLPFERAIRFGSRPLGSLSPVDEDIAWSVASVAARVPWRALCFEQGLALQRMLRRRGVDARLHYGIGKGGDGELLAHVWVTVGDLIVIGGENAPVFRAVAVYP